MLKTIILCALSAIAALAQSQTPLTVYQNQGTLPGQLWLQEKRTDGTNWWKLTVPALAADKTFTAPADYGTAGHCLKDTDGAGTLGFAACATGVDLLITDYDWSQTPGGVLTAATPATVTLTPCPAGVAPYTPHHSVGISGGTGAAESVLITAVSGSGATCDIEFTPANSHSGAWVIASLSNGEQEAINYALNNAGHRIFIPQGAHVRGKAAPGEEAAVYVQGAVSIAGANQSVNGGSEISLTHDGDWAYVVTTGATNWPVHFEKFAIQGTGLATGGGIKITATSTHNCFTKVKDMQFYTLPVGVWFEKACGQEISGNLFYGFTDAGLRLENTYDTDAGDQTVTGNNFLVIGASTAVAIDWLSAGGAKIIGNKFNVQGGGINMDLAGASIITTISGNSFDNQKLFSVRLRGTSGFLGAAITGNVVTSAGDAGYIAFDIADDTTDDIANIVVSDNSMQAAGTAIKVGDAAQVSVSGNLIGSFTTGVQVKAAATGVAVGKNTCYSVTACYDISASAGMRPTSPLFGTGYAGWAASATNTKAIAEFAPPAGGEVNNALLLQSNTTGTNSQRGIWWDSAANLYLSRFSSNRTTAQSDDLQIEADGDLKANYKVGIGRSPSTGVALDVQGVMRSTDGTTITQMYSGSGAAYIGTETNHPVRIMQDNTERLRVTNSQLLPGLTTDTIAIGDPTLIFSSVYARFGEFWKSGGTFSSDYVSTRKYNILDSSGGSGAWDMYAAGSMAASSQWTMRDNAGSRALQITRAVSGSPTRNISAFGNLYPAKRLIADGDAVDDATFGDFGSGSARWLTGYLGTTDTNTLIVNNTVSSTLNPTTNNAHDLGDPSLRWANVRGVAADFTGTATIGEVRFQAGSTHSVGATGARALRVFTDGITTGGPSYWESGSDFIMRSGSTMTLEFGTPGAGKVLTSDASGVATWQAAGGVSTPLTLTLGASGYSQPLTLSNSTVGLNGSCLGLNGHDGASTIYTVARLCAKFSSALFTDEIAELQTATGSGTYATAQSWKNLESTFYGTLLPSGTVSIGASGNDFSRIWVGGVEASSFVRPQTDLGGTNGSATKRWSASYTGDQFATGITTTGATTAYVRLGQTINANYASDYSGVAVNTWSATANHESLLDLNKSNAGTIGSHTAVASGTRLGLISFRGSDGTSFSNSSQIRGEVDGSVSSGVIPGRLLFRTATSGGTMTDRLTIDSTGLATFSAGISATGNLSAATINATGSPAYRVSGTSVIDASRNATFVGLTLSGSVASDLIPSISSTFALGSSSLRWSNAYLANLNTSGVWTNNSTITGDLIPTSSNTYVNGSSSAYWNQIAGATIFVEGGSIRPRSAGVGTVGISTGRFAKLWVTDIDFTGAMTAPSGNTGTSSTLSCGAGQAVKNITVSGGIVTSVSCGTP